MQPRGRLRTAFLLVRLQIFEEDPLVATGAFQSLIHGDRLSLWIVQDADLSTVSNEGGASYEHYEGFSNSNRTGSSKALNIGALIIRIGFGVYYTINIIRNPPKKIV